MELTVLGASGSYPSARSACSGYLLRHQGYSIWMDAGNGTLKELQRHIALTDVNAVLLSHAHPDHCADMYPFFYGLLNSQPAHPIPVITPPGVREKLESLVGGDSIERWRALLGWRELDADQETELGPFRVHAFEAAHSIVNNTLRITAGGRTLCYSGDTGPNPALAGAAQGADLFLCEASWIEAQRGIMGPIHLTAQEAGQAGREAGVGRLMLTHIWPDNDLEVVRRETSSMFEGALSFAVETEAVTV
ncbi:MAG TPA: MBL fold metallo-hydrolase [Actinomycetota bacterium]